MKDRDLRMNRRGVLQSTSTVGAVVLAGCTDSVPGLGGSGNEYEPGDDSEAMITTDYFGEGWTGQESEGDGVGEDDGPEAETGTSREFYNEDETEAVVAGIGIAEDPDTAEEIINDWTTANIVRGESVDLGDGGERGEVEGLGAIGVFDSNAAIFSGAGRQAGLELQPMDGRAYNLAQTLLDNLQEL